MRACQIHVQMAGHVMNWHQGLSASVPQGGMAQLVRKVRNYPLLSSLDEVDYTLNCAYLFSFYVHVFQTKMSVRQPRALMGGPALIWRMALTVYAPHSGLARPVR